MLWIVLPIGIAYAVRNARRQIRLLESGAAAHGTVTAKRKMAGKATTFYVSYQFSADQTQFAKEMQVRRSVFNSMEAGSAITVFYDPSDPTQNVAQELCRYQIA
jgi:hypothetical protein